MTRRQQALDGAWDFTHASDGKARVAHVPNPWAAEFADLRHMGGSATYARRFARPDLAPDEEVAIRFGAAAEVAEVRVNGRLLARHEGGYLPFEVVVPPEIMRDINDLSVICHAPDGSPGEDPPFAEMPHGKQSWYGIVGGLWQFFGFILGVGPTASGEDKGVDAQVFGEGVIILKLAQF